VPFKLESFQPNSGSSLNVNLGPALLSATKEPKSDVALTMDSYYAEVVTIDCPYCMVEPFAADARVARTERRSAETQGSPQSHTVRDAFVLPATPRCAAGTASSEGDCTSCGYGRAGQLHTAPVSGPREMSTRMLVRMRLIKTC
jgi:hypothetical protein